MYQVIIFDRFFWNHNFDFFIKLNPTFTKEEINELSLPPNDDERLVQKIAVDGSKYYTGFIGLNNIKHNDYINVVIQALGTFIRI